MYSWSETAGLISLWGAALTRAPSAVRNPRHRPLWLGVCLIAATSTLYQDAVVSSLGALIGDLNLIDLTRSLTHTASAGVMLYFVLVATGRRRHSTVLVCVVTLVMASTVWLYRAAPPHARSTISTPELPLLYWLLPFGFYLLAGGISAAVCWRHSDEADRGMLRWSLRVFGMSQSLGCVLWCLFTAYLFTHDATLLAYVPPLTGMELLLQAGSVLLPGLASALQHLEQRWVLWRLWPLWQALTEAVPTVALPGQTSRWTCTTAVRWQHYRLIIEIQDAVLALHAYTTPAMVSAARRFAAIRGVTAGNLEAAASACWLEVARRAKLARSAPCDTVCTSPWPDGSGFREDVDFLMRVARFHGTALTAEFHLKEAA
ncbi:MAB_1171c family putative transporter [Streptomyces sp. HPF1205]|uniref:MAB_1171c family putative transporter n=1 Tax=Streptomyces sp. HPF1205 TaxID=2873262 RepID=UPI001CED6E1A|nr:MAB_1171c family putative transporter [Streptomyces sp. HPF1205]